MNKCEIIWLKTITKSDLHKVGGKAFNIGLLIRKVLVPNGFCITIQALETILKNDNNIQTTLSQFRNEWNIIDIVEWGKRVQYYINKLIIEENCKEEIIKYFDQLIKDSGSTKVAIRSSGNIEDSNKFSFAGQFDTLLNIDKDSLIPGIKACLASQYSEKILYYEYFHGLKPKDVKLSILIQTMVNAEISGVIFTIDSINNNDEIMLIEITEGLGDKLVSGKITPLLLRIKKSDPLDELFNIEILRNRWQTFKEIIKASLMIENFYNCPQDIEWAIEDNKGYILQTRPITS